MVTLYTPGHHEVTDTLIMYGIIETIKFYDPFSKVSVTPLGERFIIQTNLDKHEILNAFEYYAKESWLSKNLVYLGNLPQTLRIYMLQRGNENRQLNNIIESFKFLTDLKSIKQQLIKQLRKYPTLLDKFLYFNDNHKNIIYKGKLIELCGKRSRSSAYPLIVANLPIAPFGGTMQQVGSYYLCKLCIALAWTGLFYFSGRIISRNDNIQYTYIHIFKPESTIDANTLIMLKNIAQINFFRRNPFRKMGKDIVLPSVVIPLLLLTFGETSGAILNRNWKSIIYVFTGEKKGIGWRTALRSIKTFQANTLMSFVERAKIYSNNFVRLINNLSKDEDGINALSTLSEALIYQDINELYAAFRQINRILSNNKKQTKLLDKGIIKAAFEILT